MHTFVEFMTFMFLAGSASSGNFLYMRTAILWIKTIGQPLLLVSGRDVRLQDSGRLRRQYIADICRLDAGHRSRLDIR